MLLRQLLTWGRGTRANLPQSTGSRVAQGPFMLTGAFQSRIDYCNVVPRVYFSRVVLFSYYWTCRVVHLTILHEDGDDISLRWREVYNKLCTVLDTCAQL